MSFVWFVMLNKFVILFFVSLDKVRIVVFFKIFLVVSFFNKVEKGIFFLKLLVKLDFWYLDFGL